MRRPHIPGPDNAQRPRTSAEAWAPQRVSKPAEVRRKADESCVSVRSYVESLETRLEKMEKLLNKVRFPVPCPPVAIARNSDATAA